MNIVKRENRVSNLHRFQYCYIYTVSMITYYASLEEITHYEKKVLDETVAITKNKNKKTTACICQVI